MKAYLSTKILAAGFALAMAFTNSYAQKKCAEIFNPKNSFCYDGVVYSKCDGMQYNPSTHICSGRAASRATCNGVNYNPLKQRCSGNGVLTRCGNGWYNTSAQFCFDNTVVYNKCGGKEYAPKTHHCSDAVIKKNYTGTSTFADNRDGKAYKAVGIGSQIWMAENLNYEVEGSVCSDNSDSNCDTYGRLYNWEAAMKDCPDGWHLPSDKEWQILINFVGGRDIAGKKLKAKSGWNGSGNGTDEFGFSAMPGGEGYSNGNLHVGDYGRWWSSTEPFRMKGDADDAYTWYMDYRHHEASENSMNKTTLFSVRCVKDQAP